MNKKLIFTVMLVCVLGFVAVLAFAQNNQNVRWEYFILNTRRSSQELASRANELGQQGWELVTNNNDGDYWYLMFKRRLP
jgi:hypothetical protein